MKLPEIISRHSTHFFNEKCNQQLLFIVALIALIPFVFIQNLKLQWSLVFLFLILCLLKRGKVRILPSIFIALSVTFFAVLTPYGKVIYEIKGFKLTKDALFNGLHRSGILIGMVFISQFAVSARVKLPGKAGFFIAKMFSYFDLLTQKRISFKPGNIIQSIDQRLLEIWNTEQ